MHIYAVTHADASLHIYLNYKYILQIFTVPSEVLGLRHMLSANTLTLIWRAPRKPNGKIVRYEIKLTVKKFVHIRKLIVNQNY